MASQALYLKWRPVQFDDVLGQEHVTFTLKNALTTDRVAHAYLFAGLRGTGKTSMARLLAKAVNCPEVGEGEVCPGSGCSLCRAVNDGSFMDIIEIDAASHTSVDDVRELRERVAFTPNQGKYKVYIIDEVHRFSGAAFDALLKTIEEPPEHAIFILATTEIHKVPKTILSRCQRFDFKRIPVPLIVEQLARICQDEGVEIEQEALELVARQATGSMRDSISLLDQLIAEPDNVITLELAQAILGTVSNEDVHNLVAAILADDTGYGLDLINQVLDEGADAQQFAREMIEYLRIVMLAQTGGESTVAMMASPAILEAATEQAANYPRRALLLAIKAFSEAANETGGGWQPQLPLEMAFIESVEALYASEVAMVAAPAARPAQQAAPQQHVQQQATATQQQAEQEQVAPPPADAPPMNDITKGWPRFLRVLEQEDRMIVALLQGVHPVAMNGRNVVLNVPGEFHKDKLESEAIRTTIERAMAHVYEYPLGITCRVQGQGGSANSVVEDDTPTDDLVNYAVNELGGTIKNIDESTQE